MSKSTVWLKRQNDVQTLVFDRVLSAIGVQPNTTGLGLERLGVELNPQGFVAIDDYCKTNVAGLYAIGDVARAPCLAHKASHGSHDMCRENRWCGKRPFTRP